MREDIVDANILIYAISPGFERLHPMVAGSGIATATVIEVLGYHAIEPWQVEEINLVLGGLRLLDLDDRVLTEAIRLRQARRMSLGDAILAATAFVHRLRVMTHNVRDFRGIDGIDIYDPLD